MASPLDPDELTLVEKAITCGTTGCCEWDDRASRRLRKSPPIPGFTPEGVKALLIQYVAGGGPVIQVVEKRPEYNDRRFYYKVVVTVAGYPRGLFVEIVLDDDDAELPCVRIVSAHEQS
jgi:hypothetical protein